MASKSGIRPEDPALIVEFVGPPGAGKTTLTQPVVQAVAAQGYSVLYNRGNAAASLDGGQLGAFGLNRRRIGAIRWMIRVGATSRPFVDICSRAALVRELKRFQHLVVMEEGILQQATNMAIRGISVDVTRLPLPDKVVMLKVDPEECAARRPGSYQGLSVDALARLCRRHLECAEAIAVQARVPVVAVDSREGGTSVTEIAAALA